MRTLVTLSLALVVVGCRDAGPTLDDDLDLDGVSAAEDCNDADATVYPGAEELCDGIDNDCDQVVDDVDDPAAFVWYPDADGDGFGNPNVPMFACDRPVGAVDDARDCDDARADINPDAPETDCTDPTDYNCDGSVGYADADADGWAACEDCNDLDGAVHPGADERCNGEDDDCDDAIDEDAVDAATFYADLDGDGHAGSIVTTRACDAPMGYLAAATDCDDVDPRTYPDAPEQCDGKVNACGGDLPADEVDGDGDGWLACAGDCAPTDGLAYPGADERCNDADDDCDGELDEDPVDGDTWYADLDGDGHPGDRVHVSACEAPDGYGALATDCDDLDASVYPDAPERCDGKANTCGANLPADERDDDDDGWLVCEGDCNDDDRTVRPGAPETCDGDDEDCDGRVDEDPTDGETFYLDFDGDGARGTRFTRVACEAPEGYLPADADLDCDDADDSAYPGAVDLCDGVDNDCDETVDNEDTALGGAAACAAADCNDIKLVTGTTVDGTYWIDPDGAGDNVPFAAWCDMNTEGGGWTLVGSFVNGDGVYRWTKYAGQTDHTGTWRSAETFGSLGRRLTEDYKSRAFSEVPGSELLAVDDGGRYARVTNALDGTLLDTILGYTSCQTTFRGGVDVISTDPVLDEWDRFNFYGADPNAGGRCPLNFQQDITDSSVIAFAHQGCGTAGFGHVGWRDRDGNHYDRDHYFCLEQPVVLNNTTSCGTWYGAVAPHWFADTCGYALLYVR